MQRTNHENTTSHAGRGAGAVAAGHLARLHELDDYKVADGDPDIRGWSVKTADGQKAGRVEDLIVDTEAMQVRFLDVALDRSTLRLEEDRHVLVPIASARLDDDHDDVLLGSLTAEQVAAMQPHQHGRPIATPPGDSHEQSDPRQFYGRRGGTGAVQRMTLSEEEMRVATRQRGAGAVEVRKEVETEHVQRSVPVSHEEVTIERRPVSPDTPLDTALEAGEVRIPLSAEEAVVEKRVVPREEVVIRKTTVQGEQTVEADLKKERLDVDRSGDVDKTR